MSTQQQAPNTDKDQRPREGKATLTKSQMKYLSTAQRESEALAAKTAALKERWIWFLSYVAEEAGMPLGDDVNYSISEDGTTLFYKIDPPADAGAAENQSQAPAKT